MPVVVAGLDHRTVPAAVLEQMAISAEQVPDVLALLLKSDHIAEATVLSTCMRTEIYVEAVRFHGAVAELRNVLSRVGDIPVDELSSSLFEFYDEAAIAHLFRVSAGLESAVVGEGEILGQVRRTWEVARETGAARSILSGLFRHALEAGKRARSETAISRGITSVGQAAVVMAQQRIGELTDRRVMLVGAGDMGDSMAVALSCTKGVGDILVTNRTDERASSLASRVGGSVVPFEDFPALLPDVDLVLTSTGSSEEVIFVDDVRAAMAERDGRPLVFVDVAVPHDVDPDVATIPDVTLLDMTDLRDFAETGRSERVREIDAVSRIVEEEVVRYCEDANGRLVTPVVKALRDRAEFLRLAELDRHSSRLDSLSAEEREAVESLTKSVLAKLLHDPTVRLKDAAGTPAGERMAEALRLLFGV